MANVLVICTAYLVWILVLVLLIGFENSASDSLNRFNGKILWGGNFFAFVWLLRNLDKKRKRKKEIKVSFFHGLISWFQNEKKWPYIRHGWMLNFDFDSHQPNWTINMSPFISFSWQHFPSGDDSIMSYANIWWYFDLQCSQGMTFWFLLVQNALKTEGT